MRFGQLLIGPPQASQTIPRPCPSFRGAERKAVYQTPGKRLIAQAGAGSLDFSGLLHAPTGVCAALISRKRLVG